MKKMLFLLVALPFLQACQPSEDDKAAGLMSQIDSLYRAGRYERTLDSIESLRLHHPKAIESRKKALRIWQEASLRLVQEDVGKTDSLLQATLAEQQSAGSLYERNRLRVKGDSLKARWETLCGVVRIIRAKQKEAPSGEE